MQMYCWHSLSKFRTHFLDYEHPTFGTADIHFQTISGNQIYVMARRICNRKSMYYFHLSEVLTKTDFKLIADRWDTACQSRVTVISRDQKLASRTPTNYWPFRFLGVSTHHKSRHLFISLKSCRYLWVVLFLVFTKTTIRFASCKLWWPRQLPAQFPTEVLTDMLLSIWIYLLTLCCIHEILECVMIVPLTPGSMLPSISTSICIISRPLSPHVWWTIVKQRREVFRTLSIERERY